jgi:hypothetical protein
MHTLAYFLNFFEDKGELGNAHPFQSCLFLIQDLDVFVSCGYG